MLVRGVTYNRETGVSTVRSYNTDGNRSFDLSSILSLQFGPRKVLTLANTATLTVGEASDITGTEASAPQQFSIHNTLVSDNMKLTWQIGRQSVGVRGDVSWRRTASAHDDFNDFNAEAFPGAFVQNLSATITYVDSRPGDNGTYQAMATLTSDDMVGLLGSAKITIVGKAYLTVGRRTLLEVMRLERRK